MLIAQEDHGGGHQHAAGVNAAFGGEFLKEGHG